MSSLLSEFFREIYVFCTKGYLMRSIIKLVLIVLIAVLGYNYFLGSTDEKSESREIVAQVKDLGKSIGGLIMSEKEKLEAGKYDGLFDNLENIFKKLESQIRSGDKEQREQLNDLEQDKKDLEKEVKDAEKNEVSRNKKNELEARLKGLLEKTEKLLDENK